MEHHRQCPRFDVNFESTFASDTFAGQGTITNLSMGGCSIEANIALPAQSLVDLQIQLPGFPRPLRIEQGVVRWARGNTFGLEFHALSEPDTTCLQQLLQDLDQRPLAVGRQAAH
ncbi:MAG: PilZ domain-containing protein [Nitrospira sp.]|nr:MAG: PilZ domain-containing protein [Nitrospira sp.]